MSKIHGIINMHLLEEHSYRSNPMDASCDYDRIRVTLDMTRMEYLSLKYLLEKAELTFQEARTC